MPKTNTIAVRFHLTMLAAAILDDPSLIRRPDLAPDVAELRRHGLLSETNRIARRHLPKWATS